MIFNFVLCILLYYLFVGGIPHNYIGLVAFCTHLTLYITNTNYVTHYTIKVINVKVKYPLFESYVAKAKHNMYYVIYK